MNVIFLGTSEFSVTVLNSIIKSEHKVVAVVCQPDKESGRGKKMLPPPIKTRAIELGVPVYQFAKIRRDGVETLRSLNADIMVTASYGQILSQEIIDICKYGIVNVHGSLLPLLRGASPIQSSIINGDKETGITIMRTEAGIDTGDMLISKKVVIDDCDTYGSLSDKLAIVGGELIVEALNLIEKGNDKWVPQDHNKATFTKMFKKEDTIIDFNKTSREICNLIRGLNPNPVAIFMLNGESYKVYSAKEYAYTGNEKNGTILFASGKQGLGIKCENGAIQIEEFTAPNSKRMLAKCYLNGKSLPIGSVCNE